MKNRFKKFTANEKPFIFDGKYLRIFQKEKIKDLKNIDISEQNNQKYESPRSDYLRTVCIVMNNSCNLCCGYCYANKGVYDKPNEQIKFADIKKTINLILVEIRKNKGRSISIGFFGGEPLLSFELIKKVVSFVEKIRGTILANYAITTNGTLINENIANFFKVHHFSITISIDGDKEKHNFFRKYKNGFGSYDDVKKAIHLIDQKTNILTARITITNNNPKIDSYIDSILALGIKKITFATDFKISDNAFLDFEKSLVLMVDKYCKDIKNGNMYDITNISRIVSAIVFGQKYVSHCNAGISYVTLSADGKYYRCPRFIGKEEFSFNNKNVIISKKNRENIRKENKVAKRKDGCNECSYVNLCGGVCKYHIFMSELNKIDGISKECLQRKVLFEKTLELICKLNEEERRQYLLFLSSLWDRK